MMPIKRIPDVAIKGNPVGDILLADSGDTLSIFRYPPVGNQHKMVRFYRAGFAFDIPGVGSPYWWFNDYAEDSFIDFEPRSRQTKRLDDALAHAYTRITELYDEGLIGGRESLRLN